MVAGARRAFETLRIALPMAVASAAVLILGLAANAGNGLPDVAVASSCVSAVASAVSLRAAHALRAIRRERDEIR